MGFRSMIWLDASWGYSFIGASPSKSAVAEVSVREAYIGAHYLSTCAALGIAGHQVVDDESGA